MFFCVSRGVSSNRLQVQPTVLRACGVVTVVSIKERERESEREWESIAYDHIVMF